MTKHQSTLSHTVNVNRPLCLICGAPMWIASIEPEGATHDKRVFECLGCDAYEIAVVKFN
jgi:hypothetical protein